MVEEATFSAVVEEETLLDGPRTPSRVMWLTCDPDAVPRNLAARISVLHIDQPEPQSGSRRVLSVWTTNGMGAIAGDRRLPAESTRRPRLRVGRRTRVRRAVRRVRRC